MFHKVSKFLLVILILLLSGCLFPFVSLVKASPDVETRRPNASGTYQEWDLSDTSHWGATSDQSDSTYIYTGIDEERDIQNLQDPTFGESDTINNVTVWARLRATGSAAGEKANILIRTYDTDYLGAAKGIDRGSWEEISEFYATNPNTESAWTKTEITNLEAGVQVTTIGSGEQMDCSEIWIVVDYTVGVGEYERSSSFAVSISQSVSALGEYLRGIAYSINVAFSSSVLGEFLRTVAYSVNIALNMVGAAVFERSASFALTISLATSKLGEFRRNPSYSVNVAQSTSTLGEFLRNAGYAVTISYSVSGLGSYFRTSSYPISVSLSSTGFPSFERSSSFSVTISYGTSKSGEFSRSSSYTMTVSYSGSKLSEFIRGISYNINIALSSVGEKVSVSQRFATYTVTISLGTSSSSTGGTQGFPGGWQLIGTTITLHGTTPWFGTFVAPNSTVTVRGHLEDEFGYLATNQMMVATLTWNNITIQTGTDEEGQFTFQFISPSTFGRYKVNVEYSGESQHEGTTKVYTFTVAPVHPFKLTVTMFAVIIIAVVLLWLGKDHLERVIRYIRRRY